MCECRPRISALTEKGNPGLCPAQAERGEMNSIVGDRYIAELVQIFDQQGSALFTGQHSLCLTVPCLHYIQRKIAAVHEATGNPLPAQFAHLQQLQESFSHIMVLKLIADKHYPLPPTTSLSLEPFTTVHSLILKRIPLSLITGLSRLRSQIRSLVIQRCGVESMEEVIVRCGGDDAASFAWACLRELDFSHNIVGQLGESLQFLTAIEKVDLSHNAITEDVTGIEFIDSVTYMHLGFNQLKCVPRFGPRAKYNLTGLNLRNNRLASIEGLQELDSLTDLDLTDNLLTRHSDLKPLQNLHSLCLLSLIGNPLSFHPKHRLRAVEVLSNLVNPASFRLDSKKLTSSEKKVIPRTLTHYPCSSPSLSSHTASQSPLHTRHTLTPPPNAHLHTAGDNSPSHHSDAIVIAKRRRKKPPAMRVVALHDSDEEQDSLNNTSGGAATNSASSVPLMNEKRLQRMKDLAKQMPDKWLLANASLDTTSSESNQMARGASQPRAAQEHCPLDPASMETVVKATGDNGMQLERLDKKGSKKGRDIADAAVAEPRTSTPIMVSEHDGVSGECFLVERYESDVEEGDEEGDQILLTLSERFLEEKDTNGVTVDRLDLGCLMTAEVEQKAWKSAQQSEVLVLQFSHERRDRRKREYVMIEQNHDCILDILSPISEENRKAFSLASKVECFTCQRVFDATESRLMPLIDEPQRTPPSSHSLGHQRTSLANRFCPFCKSQRLQYATSSAARAFKPPSALFSTSASPRAMVSGEPGPDSRATAAQATGDVKLGFVVRSGDAGSTEHVSNSTSAHHGSTEHVSTVVRQASDSDYRAGQLEQRIEITGDAGWGSLDNVQTYDAVAGDRKMHDKLANSGPHSDVPNQWESNEYLAPPGRDQGFSASSWSFGELSENQASQNMRSSHDVLYHSDSIRDTASNTGDSRYDAGDAVASRHDTGDTVDFRHVTGNTVDSRRDSGDTVDSRHDTRDTGDSRYGTWNAAERKCNSFDGTSRRQDRARDGSDLSRSGGKSTRLTNSEPIPKLKPYTEATRGAETGREQGREYRRYSSSEQSGFKPRNPFDDDGFAMSQHRSSPDSVPSLPRMKLHRGSLGSVQEQPSANTLNPFDESCSTNPFDEEEEGPSNPFDMEGDGEVGRGGREGEGGGRWSEEELKRRRPSFSQKEERYFTDLRPHHTVTREERNADQTDFDSPVPKSFHGVPMSSSVPAPSYMYTAPLSGHMTSSGSSGMGSHDYHVIPNKSSTLPHSSSYTSPQESSQQSTKSHTLPQGKPPIGGGLVRRKSMESLDRSSPRNEHHPTKANRVSPPTQERYVDPYSGAPVSKAAGKREEGGLQGNGDSCKDHRNSSTPPSLSLSSSGKSTPESRRGHSSSDTQRGRGSNKRLNRITSAGDVRYAGYSSGEKGRGSSSGEKDRPKRSRDDRGRGRSSAEGSRASSRSSQRGSGGGSSSGGGGGGRVKLSASGSSGGADGPRKANRLSSSGSSGRPLSTSVLIKDEDPCYVHNSLNLFLDMEVFSTERGEHFKMIFKSPMVRYGSVKEVPTVVVFSNINTYIYRITAPQSSQPDKWLSLLHTLPLSKMVYLDVGPFHQYLRLEYSLPGACLSFFLRDEDKCQKCLTRLSLIVSDCSRSSFKSVGMCPFQLENISHPDRILRKVIMTQYDKIKTSPGGRRGSEEGDGVKLYMLAHRLIHAPGKKHSKVPVTVVVAGDVIYLGRENFHHWPLPRLQRLPPKESLDPPFSSVEHKDITDIEQIIMDPDQACRLVLRFFKESVSEGESKYWSLTTELDSHVQQLVSAVRDPWESMFETTLPINYK